MNENSRCSILFHLLVPGGKWHTATPNAVWSANFCSSSFHSRSLHPLLPPPSAVIRIVFASGYRRRPSQPHQPRIEATPQAPVAWSVPTFTHPTLLPIPDNPYGNALGRT